MNEALAVLIISIVVSSILVSIVSIAINLDKIVEIMRDYTNHTKR